MSPISGRWKWGLLLALGTAAMWGVLPIALKGVMTTLDPLTTTFFRFALAAVLLTPYLLAGSRLRNRHKFISCKSLLMLLTAGLLLATNYGLYIIGLEKTTAEAAQLVIQLAPMLLLLAGLWFFRERLVMLQWLGCVVFVVGLLLFFNEHLIALIDGINDYAVGLLIIVFSAVAWAGYAIIQKFLLVEFSAAETMLMFYWIGALVFLPLSDFSTLQLMSPTQWLLLGFCGINTLVAYGCFAEALVHLEATRVSATITVTPLITIVIVQLIPIPGIETESLQLISIVGALMAVGGSMLTAVARKVSIR